MRVAYITRAPFISGAERALQLILRHAPAFGIEPVVVCPGDSPFKPWCERHHVPVVAMELAERDKRHPLRWLLGVVRMWRALRAYRVDVVHSNQVWAFAAAGTAARLLGLPRVCHMRDEVSPMATRWWCKSGVEAVISISDHIRRQVEPAWDGETARPLMRTARDPVQLPAAVDADDSGRDAARARLGLPANGAVFGFIGQLVRIKGLMELLEALAPLVAAEDWTLAVAGRDPGDGRPYETACREWVRRNGLERRVTFLGFLDDVHDFYRAVDVVVVPSLQEPLGLIPLEAAAAGKPSIAFASGGLNETIVDQQTGWLVPTGDIDALRLALQSALRRPGTLPATGAAARARVAAEFSPVEHLQELTALYAQLLARGDRQETT